MLEEELYNDYKAVYIQYLSDDNSALIDEFTQLLVKHAALKDAEYIDKIQAIIQFEEHVKGLIDISKKYTELTFLEKILASLKVLINKKKIFKKYVDKEEYIAQISFLEGAITRIFSVKSNFKTKKIAWVHNDMQKVFGNGIKAKIKKIMDEKAYQKYNDIIFVSEDNEKAFNSFYKENIKSRKNIIKKNLICHELPAVYNISSRELPMS